MTPQETLDALKITVESQFVPFSQSRSKEQDMPNLNWIVTVKYDGRDVLTTEYSAGQGHCPGYNKKAPAGWKPSTYQRQLCAFECETGKEGRLSPFGNDFFKAVKGESGKSRPIEPNPVDVLYSLVMDYTVLDAGGFEYWAGDLGYDTDSRKAESIYRECLELALKMRAGFGESDMDKLQMAFQDY